MSYLLFSAPWCEPCKRIKPITMEKLRDDCKTVDVSQDAELAAEWKIRSIPTLVNTDTYCMLVGDSAISKFLGELQ